MRLSLLFNISIPHIKLDKIQKIIQHYSDKKLRVDDNVINVV